MRLQYRNLTCCVLLIVLLAVACGAPESPETGTGSQAAGDSSAPSATVENVFPSASQFDGDQPLFLCTVATGAINLRLGPGVEYSPPIRSMYRGTVLVPLSRHEDTNWIKVRVEGSNEEGWVNASTRYVSCSGSLSSLPIDDTTGVSTTLPYQVEFTADDTTVEEGECTTLRWDVENVQAVYLDGEGVVGHSNKTVCPKQTQTYTLHVVTVSGTQDYEATVSVPAVVGVQFAADNNTIKSGECTTLRWDVKNVQAVYLDGGGVVEHGSTTACPKETQTYTLRVVTASGTQDYEATVSVIPPAVLTAQLTEDYIKGLVKQISSQADHPGANIIVTVEEAGVNQALVITTFDAKEDNDVKVTVHLLLYIQGDRLKTEITMFQVKKGGTCDFNEVWDPPPPSGELKFTLECGPCPLCITRKIVDENARDIESKLDRMLEGTPPVSVQSLQVQGNGVLVTYIPY